MKAATLAATTSVGGLLPIGIIEQALAGPMSPTPLPATDPGSYGLLPGETVNDLANRHWDRLCHAWALFADRQIRDGSATTSQATLRQWLDHLFTALEWGRLVDHKPVSFDDEQTYPITHQFEQVPAVVVGSNVPLDRRTPGVPQAASKAPHAMLQELLNRDNERLWGIATNGQVLRILRDNNSLTRASYVEFDLEAIFSGRLWTDYLALVSILHRSRVAGTPEASVLEQWQQLAGAVGTRALGQLQSRVHAAIDALGAGLVADTTGLRTALRAGKLSNADLYRQLLTTVYRLLFVLVAEDRDLLHPPGTSEETRSRYRYYSINRLRDYAANYRGSHLDHDMWEGLQVVFRALGTADGAPRLGVPGLGSRLWDQDATPDLVDSRISNRSLLDVLRALGFLEDNRTLVRVDYRNLGAEELGSVYEALLDLQPDVSPDAPVREDKFRLTSGSDERHTTGSHYTPPAVIQQLLDWSLPELLQQARRSADPESALLDLKVVDPTCGSGHFLVAAARRIADEVARVRTGDLNPSPEALRTAFRDVVSRCIYGVDLNPLAVDLAKVALWLETLDPGKPLGFLDHHIRRGNALVGVPLERTWRRTAEQAAQESKNPKRTADTVTFGSWPHHLTEAAFHHVDRDKAAATAHRKAVRTRVKDVADGKVSLFRTTVSLPPKVREVFAKVAAAQEDTPADVERRADLYRQARQSAPWMRAKLAADFWCSTFFLPLPELRTQTVDEVFDLCKPQEGEDPLLPRPTSVPVEWLDAVEAAAADAGFFQWEMVFPEVFDRPNGGFDLVVGNPPYLGGKKISGEYGLEFLRWLQASLPESNGHTNFAVYFLRRGYYLLREGGHLAFVTTDALAETGSRSAGLDIIVTHHGGAILDAVRSQSWAGAAAVNVTTLHLCAGESSAQRTLDGKAVSRITTSLGDGIIRDEHPQCLNANRQRMWMGAILNGDGFVVTQEVAAKLISLDDRNAEVIKPLWGGQDLNSTTSGAAGRLVIDFNGMCKRCAQRYREPFRVVEETVWKDRRARHEAALAKSGRSDVPVDTFWRYHRNRPELSAALAKITRCVAFTKTSKHAVPVVVRTGPVFQDSLYVAALDSCADFAALASELHYWWLHTYGGTMRSAGLTYVTEVFETFPRPEHTEVLGAAGKQLDTERRQIQSALELGLTKLYNRFCDSADRACEIQRLRELHRDVTAAAVAAYGWNDLTLSWGFHETKLGDERYTLDPEPRYELLSRLLDLNLELATER